MLFAAGKHKETNIKFRLLKESTNFSSTYVFNKRMTFYPIKILNVKVNNVCKQEKTMI
jgi:hypothetical protein